MQRNEKESIKYLQHFEKPNYVGTKIYPKALYTLCAIAVQCRMDRDGKFYDKIWRRGFPLLQTRGKGTVWAEKGLFYHAFVLDKIDQPEATKLYELYLKQYPKGTYREIAMGQMGQIKSNE